MCEPQITLPPPSSPPFQLRPKTPSHILQRMATDSCFHCKQQGHWMKDCPLKSQNNNSYKSLTSSIPFKSIPCRCGHGFCDVIISHTAKNPNRKFFVCPIKRGARCKDFIKWCDQIEESDLQPPLLKYPLCECGAGVCRKMKEPDRFKYYFVCPIKQDHGSCGFRVSEDELLNNTSILPFQQTSLRSVDEIMEGSQNDTTHKDLVEGGDLVLTTKNMRINDNPENHSLAVTVSVSDIPEVKDGESPIEEAKSQRIGFPDLKFDDDDDDLDFTKVSWDVIEAEASASSRLSTPWSIRHRQSLFQSDMGIFPSFNSIVVPEQTGSPNGDLAVNSISKHDQFSIENSPTTLEEHKQILEKEKAKLAHIQDDYIKAKALFEAFNKQRKTLSEEVRRIEAMLHDKQMDLKSCELETMKIETHLCDLKRNKLDADTTFKDRVRQVEAARQKSVERRKKQIEAKTTLEMAKRELEK